jgi:hypothetical protein
MTLTAIGITILAIGGFWLFGGVVLRVVGAIFIIVGALSLVTVGELAAFFMVVLGLLMWLAGHWHFALRHHEYKSPLAERIFQQLLPERLDPTRGWAVHTVPGKQRHDAGYGDDLRQRDTR